ncbi:DUF2157 domain-containing protein [Oxalobacteraceae bacterium]|nr:DUF2157 domain-containing protein [Oxalobacteraceae bacterium]
MSLRIALLQQAERHQLNAQQTASLFELAQLGREPGRLLFWLPRGAAIAGAALAGLGVIFWIAANWAVLGQFGRFALLEGFFAALCAGAIWRPAARVPLALLALLTIGGLFACFGQTYQTGADAWQLFALWAVLALPLCIGARHDALWMPWVLVFMAALNLWRHAHGGFRWDASLQDLPLSLLATALVVGLTLLLHPSLRRHTGSGSWSFRFVLLLATMQITGDALAAQAGGWDHGGGGIALMFWLGLLILGGAACVLSQPRTYDIFGLSVLALALNVLIDCEIIKLLFSSWKESELLSLLLAGFLIAVLLGWTVKLLVHITRKLAQGETVHDA